MWEAYASEDTLPSPTTRERQDSDLDPVLRRRKARKAKAAVGFVDEDETSSPYLFADSPPSSGRAGGGGKHVSLFDSTDEEEGGEDDTACGTEKITPIKKATSP